MGNLQLSGNLRCILILIVLSFVLYFFLNQKLGSSHPQANQENVTASETNNDCWLPAKHNKGHGIAKKRFLKENKLDSDTKIVLLYTGLFFNPWWWSNHEQNLHNYTHEKNCKFKTCYFTYEKSMFDVADAVIFHGVDLSKPNCLRTLSELRPTNQRWILFMHESPLYTFNLKPYNGLFNWTMTYMQGSDIYLPYFNFKKLSPKRHRPKLGHNFASGKTGKVVWVVSHCGLLRDVYALELEKYIDLDVYGDCGAKFKRNMGRCSDWGTQCKDELKKYKFYLAFENCFCKDYVTEKYWEKGLKYGMLPVVMGAFEAESNVIPRSYIDVNNYDSVEALAKHLLYLDGNDTAYNEYFQWKYNYKVTNGGDCFCKICEALHGKHKNQVYNDISDFWSRKKHCDSFNWKINEIKIQISKSKFKFRNN